MHRRAGEPGDAVPVPQVPGSARACRSKAGIGGGDRPSDGFFRNKTKAIRELSAAIVERHGGKVPATMDALTALPGVGRKTASILLGGCFGVNALPVDTHVGRVSFRLGLTASKDPDRIEQDLSAVVPATKRWEFATRLGWHGRQVCVARKPKCPLCGLLPVCPRNGVK
jgi:endonuclease-3